jgi:RNA polymerase sigma factor (sigma-70 family)
MAMTFNGSDLIPRRRSLLTRLKDWGDQAGWQEFLDTYWRLIHSLAPKAGLTDAEAQDVVQETMIEVAKKMPGFRYDPALGSFKGWLLHTTQWKISAQFKRRRHERREIQLPEDNGTATSALERLPDPISLDWDRVWEVEWERNLLEAALEKLKLRVSPEQFEIFYLHVLKEQPVKEVAATLEVSAGRVYLARHHVACHLEHQILDGLTPRRTARRPAVL